MKSIPYALTAVLLVFTLCQPAQAGNVTLGYTGGSAEASDNTLFDNASGAAFFVGYQSEYLFGFEFGVFAIVDEHSDTTTTDDVTLGGRSLTLTFTVPLGFISVFGRGGIADWALYLDEQKIDDGHSATYGGGLDFYFNERWAARVEQQRFIDIGPSEMEIIHTRLGIVYTF